MSREEQMQKLLAALKASGIRGEAKQKAVPGEPKAPLFDTEINGRSGSDRRTSCETYLGYAPVGASGFSGCFVGEA